MDAPTQPTVADPGGWTPENWSREAAIGRTTFYCLPADCKPASVKIGRRLVITESPSAWLARMAARGGVQTQTRASKVAA